MHAKASTAMEAIAKVAYGDLIDVEILEPKVDS